MKLQGILLLFYVYYNFFYFSLYIFFLILHNFQLFIYSIYFSLKKNLSSASPSLFLAVLFSFCPSTLYTLALNALLFLRISAAQLNKVLWRLSAKRNTKMQFEATCAILQLAVARPIPLPPSLSRSG